MLGSLLQHHMSEALLLTSCKVLQAAMTPFVGAAGKILNRIFLAMLGTLIWGTTNIGIGLASTFNQVSLCLAMLLRMR